MSKITRMERVTPWRRALNAARRTAGKLPLDKKMGSPNASCGAQSNQTCGV